MDNFYDPLTKVTPKTKKIFKIERTYNRLNLTGQIQNDFRCHSKVINALDPKGFDTS